MDAISSPYIYEAAKNILSVDSGATLPLAQSRSKIYSKKRGELRLPISDSVIRIQELTAVVHYLITRYNDWNPVSIGLATSSDGQVNLRVITDEIDSEHSISKCLNILSESVRTARLLGPSDINQIQEIVGDSIASNPMFKVGVSERCCLASMLDMKSDIVLYFDNDSSELCINYNYRYFSDKCINDFANFVVRHLEIVSAGNNVAIKNISIELEYAPVLNIDDLTKDCGAYSSVIKLLKMVVDKTPNAIAVEQDDRQVSYSSLWTRSGEIANSFRRKDSGTRYVGICFPPGIDQLTFLIGVLRSGCSVVPIDYSLPKSRLANIYGQIEFSEVVVAECFSDLLRSCGISHTTKFTNVDVVDSEETEDMYSDNTIAYVLFTSGSSGLPKGVQMPHSALGNLIEWQLNRSSEFGIPITLNRTSIAFDVGFQEVFYTLCAGGRLVVASDEVRSAVDLLPEMILGNSVTTLYLPPVSLHQLSRIYDCTEHDIGSLKEVIVAGEQLKIDRSIISLARANTFSLDNQYGPTETHVCSAYRLSQRPMRWSKLPSIGSEIQNVEIQIVDKFQNKLPTGAVGEIAISGDCVALSYINESTEGDRLRRFINSIPTYLSGDYGHRDNTGNLHFVGRHDEQVKIRGYRVELSEIESAVLQLADVDMAAAKVFYNNTDDMRLTLFYCSESYESIAVWRKLKEYLPDYMVPSWDSIVRMNSMPLTSTGKVDKALLECPVASPMSNAPPEFERFNGAEKQVAEILCNELKCSSDALLFDHTFIDLGGDSLKAIQVIISIEQKFGISVPLRNIVRGTVKSIARDVAKDMDLEVDPFVTQKGVKTKLENGLEIHCVHSLELSYLYQDIYEYNSYNLPNHFRNGSSVVVDIGSHVGLFSLQVLNKYDDVIVVACEPSIELFNCLQKNLVPYSPRVKVLNCAIGCENKMGVLGYYPSAPGMSSMYANLEEEEALFNSIISDGIYDANQFYDLDKKMRSEILDEKWTLLAEEVSVRTLSDVISSESLHRIDLLKIDVQKSELDVLAGINEEHWAIIGDIVIELHDIDGCADNITGALVKKDYSVKLEKHPLHPSSSVRMVYASKELSQ